MLSLWGRNLLSPSFIGKVVVPTASQPKRLEHAPSGNPNPNKRKKWIHFKKKYKYVLFHKPFNVLCQFTDNNDAHLQIQKQKQLQQREADSLSDNNSSNASTQDKQPSQPQQTIQPQSQSNDSNTEATPLDTTRKTLSNYIRMKNIYPIGRLDYDSEGVLLLTDNVKGLTQQLLHPQQKHERVYYAQVEGIPKPEDLKKLTSGVQLREFTTMPIKAEVLPEQPKGIFGRRPPVVVRENVPTTWLKLTLNEGKNRQVRRMTAHIGYPTLRLIRASFAGLGIENMRPGQWRDLTDFEVAALENKCKLPPGKRNSRVAKPQIDQEQKEKDNEMARRKAEEGRRKKTKHLYNDWWKEHYEEPKLSTQEEMMKYMEEDTKRREALYAQGKLEEAEQDEEEEGEYDEYEDQGEDEHEEEIENQRPASKSRKNPSKIKR